MRHKDNSMDQDLKSRYLHSAPALSPAKMISFSFGEPFVRQWPNGTPLKFELSFCNDMKSNLVSHPGNGLVHDLPGWLLGFAPHEIPVLVSS